MNSVWIKDQNIKDKLGHFRSQYRGIILCPWSRKVFLKTEKGTMKKQETYDFNADETKQPPAVAAMMVNTDLLQLARDHTKPSYHNLLGLWHSHSKQVHKIKPASRDKCSTGEAAWYLVENLGWARDPAPLPANCMPLSWPTKIYWAPAMCSRALVCKTGWPHLP